MSGSTENWRMAVKMFDLHFKRLGFADFETTETKEKQTLPLQQSLF
jgi:hypothetical protein